MAPRKTKTAAPKKAKSKAEPRKAPVAFVSAEPSQEPKRRGRPSSYQPGYCDRVRELGAEGKSRAQIAASIGVNRDTINEWSKIHPDFSVALKDAKDLELSWWESAGQKNMTIPGFNATAFIFQMKNRFRDDYRDESVVKNINRKEIHDLSDAELAAIATGRGSGNPEKEIGSSRAARVH